MSAFPYKLYLVVSADGCAGRDFVEVTERAIEGGVDVVQLREKGVPDELFLERALRLKEMLDRRGVPLVINDNVDVARRCGAWGVHVGVNDMSPVRVRELWPECGSIGLSIESLRQLGVTENGVTGCYDAAGNNLIVNDLTGNVVYNIACITVKCNGNLAACVYGKIGVGQIGRPARPGPGNWH